MCNSYLALYCASVSSLDALFRRAKEYVQSSIPQTRDNNTYTVRLVDSLQFATLLANEHLYVSLRYCEQAKLLAQSSPD